MARNEEKAMTLFSRWQSFKSSYHSSASNRRPLLTSECNNISEAEKWRRDLVNDITKKVSAIQNATLGEHRIREMNEEINKMMRQKYYWENRIRELGGDVQKGRQFYDVEGKELPGVPGYKYYGAAKDLPGIRELFAEEDQEVEVREKKRTRGEMNRNITPDYYGFRDDDDDGEGGLMKKELIREMEWSKRAEEALAGQREKAKVGWLKHQKERNIHLEGKLEDQWSLFMQDSDDEVEEGGDGTGMEGPRVASDGLAQGLSKQKEGEGEEADPIALEKKKQELLDRVASLLY